MPHLEHIVNVSAHEVVEERNQDLTTEAGDKNQEQELLAEDSPPSQEEIEITELNDSIEYEPSERDRYVKIEEDILNIIEEVRRMPLERRPVLIKLQENKKFKILCEEVNKVVNHINISHLDLNDLNLYNYGCALYIQRQIAPWNNEIKPNKNHIKTKIPPWKQKINRRMNQLRAEIGQMTTKEPLTKNLIKRLQRLKRKYNISEEQFISKIAEHSTQLKALSAEVRNKTKKAESKNINKLFKENPRNVYRKLTEDEIIVEKPPLKEDLEKFWRPLFETPKYHKESEWVQEIVDKNSDKPEMSFFISLKKM